MNSYKDFIVEADQLMERTDIDIKKMCEIQSKIISINKRSKKAVLEKMFSKIQSAISENVVIFDKKDDIKTSFEKFSKINVKEHNDIVINLEGIDKLNSVQIGILIHLHKILRRYDGKVSLINVSQSLMTFLSYLNINKVLSVKESSK